MSVAPAVRAWLGSRPTADRTVALAGAAVLTAAYLVPLYRVIDVVGGPGGLELFVALVAGSLGLAVVLARTLRLRAAVGVGSLLLAVGLGAYLLTVPEGALDLGRQARDTVALLTGLSVLRMTNAAVWALGFTPGPLFVSTFLFLRRRYTLGVLVGGAALAFFVSTGDVGEVHGLVAALGALAALGFGRLDWEGGTRAQRDVILVLLVAALVVTTSLSLVPGGEARPLLPDGHGTVETNLVGGGDSVTVRGSIELSPAVRFTVQADRPAQWRVGAYDRYTGDGWVRAGQSQPYEGTLGRPPGDPSGRLVQTYRVESEMAVMPAAWKPARVISGAGRASVTSMEGLEPRGTLAPGDEYRVVSYPPPSTPADLRAAGTDYPDGLTERYAQLPESTPERVGTFTARLTSAADTPYDTARVVERWLQSNKAYSLDVDRPRGDIAASFIFDMDRGYCTYYATAMVAMLRSQGIPARFVVGYTAGEAIGGNRWLVRGLDSHAWVEVYFPNHGWVAFDPTPSGPRAAAEQTQLDRARAAEATDVYPEGVTPRERSPMPLDGGQPTAPDEPADVDGGVDGTPTIPAGLRVGGQGPGVDDGSGDGDRLPDGETVLYGLILLVGAATAAHRTGVIARGRRGVWVRWEPDGPPARRVEATFDRLDYLLGRRYRPRRRGETPRVYLRSLRERYGTSAARSEFGPHDSRLDELFDLYERAHYAGRATQADADRAWQLFTALREEWSGGG